MPIARTDPGEGNDLLSSSRSGNRRPKAIPLGERTRPTGAAHSEMFQGAARAWDIAEP
jgi:hypothetical protein